MHCNYRLFCAHRNRDCGFLALTSQAGAVVSASASASGKLAEILLVCAGFLAVSSRIVGAWQPFSGRHRLPPSFFLLLSVSPRELRLVPPEIVPETAEKGPERHLVALT
eukprot:1569979-Rhodomonas_salina.2